MKRLESHYAPLIRNAKELNRIIKEAGGFPEEFYLRKDKQTYEVTLTLFDGSGTITRQVEAQDPRSS